MKTFNESIQDLLLQTENPQVKALLLQAADLQAAAPVWKTARVRMKQKNCPTCKDGVVFEGQNRIEEE